MGHVTLAMGTGPVVHGMVANIWFDRDTYNIEDDRYSLLTAGAG